MATREIKFRAWSPSDNCMVQSFEISQYTDEPYPAKDLKIVTQWTYYQEAPDLILMQYTGLKDKNGIDIYEGDLCQYTHHDGMVYIQQMYALDNYHFWSHVWENLEDEEIPNPYEIVGNIYENKELLK